MKIIKKLLETVFGLAFCSAFFWLFYAVATYAYVH